MKKILTLLLVFTFVGFASDIQAQKKKKKKSGDATEQEKPKKKDGLKDYAEVITDEAKTDDGLITSHQVGDNYFFEISSDLLEKEILIVSRISGHVKGLNFGGCLLYTSPSPRD